MGRMAEKWQEQGGDMTENEQWSAKYNEVYMALIRHQDWLRGLIYWMDDRERVSASVKFADIQCPGFIREVAFRFEELVADNIAVQERLDIQRRITTDVQGDYRKELVRNVESAKALRQMRSCIMDAMATHVEMGGDKDDRWYLWATELTR